ncbi:unnamed protein product [Adineta steineri]|uniref:Uncharacterized protein n=1 Tax=Adineta steineri TaxID=433720 RepID=A0A819PLT8_9BILA|nr:unnamed protein product [Adineta steineri]CAF4012799.1 unnamed protein product [Adineta steineri]
MIFFRVFLYTSIFDSVINVRLNLFDKIIVFGDSNTDGGNVYKLTNNTWPITPPYYQGRFTNGPNWFDRLNASSKSNYAYGGATTDNNFVKGYTKLNLVLVPGIRQQIASYFNDTLNTTINFNRTMYILWAGGNDFIANSSITVSSLTNSFMNSVRDLLKFGAKNILIFNQAPIQVYPYFSRQNLSATYTALTLQINNALQASLNSTRNNYTNVSIQTFDLNALVTKVVANQSYPFANNVSKCWDNVNLTTVALLCSDPTTYVFIDSIHMTTPVHQLIADAVTPLLTYTYTYNGYSKMNLSLNMLVSFILIHIFF